MVVVYFDEVFRPLGLFEFTVTEYLLLVFTLFFGLSLLVFRRKAPTSSAGTGKWMLISGLLILFSIFLVLLGLASSYGLYHYSLPLILGVFLSYIAFFLVLSSNIQISKYGKLLLPLIVLLVVFFGSRPLINGVEEQETTSDTINIYMNGFFRWSIHGGHYDLAPVDSIVKVFLLRVTGINNIFDPATASMIYIAHGLTYILLLYAFLRSIHPDKNTILPLVGLALSLYPYSAMVGLSAPPAPLSQLMGSISLLNILKILVTGRFAVADVVAALLTLTYSVLAHPSALGLLLLTVMLAAAPSINRNSRRAVLLVALVGFTVYFSKVLYTAFAQGFVSYLTILWSYIVSALSREEALTTFTTRNVGFSGLPRICLTAFAVFPAVLAGYTLPILLRALRERKISTTDFILIAAAILYGAFLLASFLTGVGGVSQSRALFNGVQPYAEIALIVHAVIARQRSVRSLAALLLVASLATLITPNAAPLNYTIPMAKPATENDHIVAYTFFRLLDKETFLAFYNNPEYGRIIAEQVESLYSYGLGSTQAVTYFYIAPRIVDARSYWDPRIMAIFRAPSNASDYVESTVFSAWVYVFKVYIVKAG